MQTPRKMNGLALMLGIGQHLIIGFGISLSMDVSLSVWASACQFTCSKTHYKISCVVEKKEFLLFFVPKLQFLVHLDCDDCDAWCTWITTGFFNVVPEYGFVLCVCLISCVRGFQVKYYCCIDWLNFQHFLLLNAVCGDFLLFFLCFAIALASKLPAHNIRTENILDAKTIFIIFRK